MWQQLGFDAHPLVRLKKCMLECNEGAEYISTYDKRICSQSTRMYKILVLLAIGK